MTDWSALQEMARRQARNARYVELREAGLSEREAVDRMAADGRAAFEKDQAACAKLVESLGLDNCADIVAAIRAKIEHVLPDVLRQANG